MGGGESMVGFLIYLFFAILMAVLVKRKSPASTPLLKNKDFWMLEGPALVIYLLILFARPPA
jgi:hypothetical protein